jgi:hypothetical protein
LFEILYSLKSLKQDKIITENLDALLCGFNLVFKKCCQDVTVKTGQKQNKSMNQKFFMIQCSTYNEGRRERTMKF